MAKTKKGSKLGEVKMVLRVALTGGMVSPPIDLVMEILGKEETIRRIERCRDYLESRPRSETGEIEW